MRLTHCCSILVCVAVASQAHALFSFAGLSDLAGGSFNSGATAISADGNTIVGWATTAAGTEAMRWTLGGGMVSIGDLSGGTVNSTAYGVSANGLVVVGQAQGTYVEAFRWTQGGGILGLGYLDNAISKSKATGVSADGNVVVGSSTYGTNNGGKLRAFRWTAANGLQALASSPISEANAVSSDGNTATGFTESTGAYPEAFRWTLAGGLLNLGMLPGDYSSAGTAISGNGQVIGGRSLLQAQFGSTPHSVRWTQAEGFVNLGRDAAEVHAASADGSVLVGSVGGFGGATALMFYKGGVFPLQEWLALHGTGGLTGWKLEMARGVSADGRTIVGSGRSASGSEAWRVTLDLPTTVLRDILPAAPQVVCGNPFSATVRLTDPAPVGGVTVSLIKGGGNPLTIPQNVVVPAGSTTAGIPITTQAVSSETTASITARFDTIIRTCEFNIRPAALVSLSVNPQSVTGGTSSTGTVGLNGLGSQTEVSLSDNTSAITVPQSVIVHQATSATFPIGTTAVSTTATRQVYAAFGLVTKTANLTLTPSPVLVSLSLNPSTVLSGSSTTGKVTLSGAALAGGALVTLTDNTTAITTPPDVTVPQGALSATFTATTSPLGATATRAITATYGSVVRSAQLTLTQNIALNSLTLNPSTVKGGSSTVGTVSLTVAAPAGGKTVTLSDNSGAIATPASAFIAAGSASKTFTVGTSPVSATATRQVTASLDGVTKTANLTLTP